MGGEAKRQKEKRDAQINIKIVIAISFIKAACSNSGWIAFDALGNTDHKHLLHGMASSEAHLAALRVCNRSCSQ